MATLEYERKGVLLEMRSVFAGYGSTPILRDLNAEIRNAAGEVVATATVTWLLSRTA